MEDEATLYGSNVDINDPAVQDYYDKNNKDPRQPPPPRK
jgi:hypothetical protein